MGGSVRNARDDGVKSDGRAEEGSAGWCWGIGGGYAYEECYKNEVGE